jgi:uncharacterized transporter YbjL
MDRTLRAALTAFLIGLVAVGGIAVFLGVPAGASLVAGLVAGVLFGGLILAAARRSQAFDDQRPPDAGP